MEQLGAVVELMDCLLIYGPWMLVNICGFPGRWGAATGNKANSTERSWMERRRLLFLMGTGVVAYNVEIIYR